jgi:glutamine amidotransferase
VCRHLAYAGPPVALRDLLYDAPHALARQARAPRLQNAGNDNPHGWGVVAWDPPRREHYRTATPMWEDGDFAAVERAKAVIAAARYASPGFALRVENVAPFVVGAWCFSLNGVVRGFHDGLGDRLRGEISATTPAIEGETDSAVLFALVLERLRDGATPGEALVDVARLVRHESDGALNLLLTDGEQIAATAIDNSLFVRVDSGVLVASEPLDGDESWVAVDNGSLIENDRVSPIEGLQP